MRLRQYFEISQVNDIFTLQRLLGDMAADMGFHLFNAMLVAEDQVGASDPLVHIVEKRPSAFVSDSRSKANVARCPVIRQLKKSAMPFIYDQRLFVGSGAADLWEQAAAYGYKAGIGVAIHLPHQRHFVLSMDRDLPLPNAGETTERLLTDLQLLAVYAEVAAEKLMLPSLMSDLPKLSKRELEVLRWAMEGKTAWEVGAILSISERSVVFHTNNGMRKLGAVNKHQAALKALHLGLIQ